MLGEQFRGQFDDLFQETLLRMWSKAQREPDFDQPFQPYFFRSLQNCVKDSARRKTTDPATPTPSDSDEYLKKDSYGNSDSGEEERSWLDLLFALADQINPPLISRLTEDEQKILDLTIQQGMNYEEITNSGLFVNKAGKPLDPATLRVKRARTLENLRSHVIRQFLPGCVNYFGQIKQDINSGCPEDKEETTNNPSKVQVSYNSCPDLLNARYGELRNNLTELKQKYGNCVETYISLCLRNLKLCIIEKIANRINLSNNEIGKFN